MASAQEEHPTPLTKVWKFDSHVAAEQVPAAPLPSQAVQDPSRTPTTAFMAAARSARGCREFRRLNPFLLHTGSESSRPACNCNYIHSCPEKYRLCDACNKDLGDARYAQEMHLLDIVKQEDSGVSKNDHARRIHGLGIRLSALIAFAYAHDCWDWPTWMIVRDIVKPATKVSAKFPSIR